MKISDRAKDIIISGGENVSSVEVEGVLMDHPAVLLCAVVAKPDEKWGEVPCAFGHKHTGHGFKEQDLIAHAPIRLAGFKTPRRVFEELPQDLHRQDPEIRTAQAVHSRLSAHMILGIGTDLANIERIAGTLERFGDRFRNRVSQRPNSAKANVGPTRPNLCQTLGRQGGLLESARNWPAHGDRFEGHVSLEPRNRAAGHGSERLGRRTPAEMTPPPSRCHPCHT